MPRMFGVRYAVVKGSLSLDSLITEKIVVAHPVDSQYKADKYAVASKGVNKQTIKRIAKALAES